MLLFITVIRTLILYFIIIFSIRIMGKRQIGDLQPGELVITILISEIAAIPIQDPSQPLLTGVAAVITLVFIEILISVLAMKCFPLRRFFYGTSAIVINNGVIDQKKLKSLRVTGPDLLEVLRNREIFDVNRVAYAILETNGQLSVMLKPDFQNATVADLNNTASQSEMPNLIISDGKYVVDELKNSGHSKNEIKEVLQKEGLHLKDVFIMTCDNNLNYSIIKKEKDI